MHFPYQTRATPELNSVVQRQAERPTQNSAKIWKREPSLREAILIWATAAVVFIGTASHFRPYIRLALDFGDTTAYLQIADAIRTWNFSGIFVKHFWGLPYLIAVISKLTGISVEIAILLISASCSLAALIFAHRLWGGWVALFFSILNFDWWQRSFLGGAEPLFVLLLFAAFFAIRRQSWYWAALLASLATITRPLGVCLLVGIGFYLLWNRAWRQLSGTVAISGIIALLYILPLRLYLHDALATVHSYGVMQSTPYPPLFGIPFRAMIVGTFHSSAPWSNLLLSFAWITLVLAGNIAMIATKDFRSYARTHPAETIFAGLYSLSLYCYNLPAYARSNFARFSIPILPFIFLALLRWLPKDRRLFWVLAIVSAALAACSAVGLENVFAALHRAN